MSDYYDAYHQIYYSFTRDYKRSLEELIVSKQTIGIININALQEIKNTNSLIIANNDISSISGCVLYLDHLPSIETLKVTKMNDADNVNEEHMRQHPTVKRLSCDKYSSNDIPFQNLSPNLQYLILACDIE